MDTTSTYLVKLLKQILIPLAFLIGAIANLIALWILNKSAKYRNRKHVFLLRCLAVNDFVAQIGMLGLLQLNRFKLLPIHWFCASMVILRGFGIGSGCVAFAMALERWFALTRPFFYHQIITYQMLKRGMCILWIGGIILTYLPLFGFGIYYNVQTDSCMRFRYAIDTTDRIYAYLFFLFGSMLCSCIVFFNAMVIRELLNIRKRSNVLLRRVTKTVLITTNCGNNCNRYETPEEVQFAKLMAVICAVFIICWTPQVISVPISQLFPESKLSKNYASLADVLMSIYFTLDPFIYVLERYMEKENFITPCCWFVVKRGINKAQIMNTINDTSTTNTNNTTTGISSETPLNSVSMHHSFLPHPIDV